jgi:membrane associated rhomboid family serine protease
MTYAFMAACIGVQIYLDVARRVDGGGMAERAVQMMDWGTLWPSGIEGAPGFHWWQLLTYAFLHAGWWHLLGNMVFLWVFGPNLEDRLGRVWFAVFYLVGAVVSGGVHIFFARQPVIGASGAIAACTGAYLVMFPRTQIRVLFLLFLNVFMMSAWWFIVLSVAWEWLSPLMGGGADHVAHLAHLGGYLYGIAVALVLLWLKIVPREVYDLFSIGRQAYRRRAFKEAGLAVERARKEKWERAKRGGAGDAPGGVDPDVIAAARAEIVSKMTAGDMAGGARGYKELADRYAHVPGAATLSRRWQYALANWFYQEKDPDAAAFAYARFLEAYPRDAEAGHIRLLLGMIHARSLNDPVKAKALIAEALKTLEGEEAEMAKKELEALG